MKKITILLLIIIGLVMLSSCAPNESADSADNKISTSVSWAHGYNDFEEMISDSFITFIVVGEIENIASITKEELLETERGVVYDYYTDFNFRIDTLLRGEKDTKSISLRQTGAPDKFELSEDPLFKSGETYILFLHEYSEGKAFVVGGPAGRFRIIDGNVYSMNYLLPPDACFVSNGLDTNSITKDDFISMINELSTSFKQ